MSVVTLYVDASRCDRTGAAGWASWLRKGDEVATRGGRLRKPARDGVEAGMAAAANGIAAAAASGLARRGDTLVMISGCAEVVQVFEDARVDTRASLLPIMRTAHEIADRAGFLVRARSPRAFGQASDAGRHVDHAVRDMARSHMLQARAEVLPAAAGSSVLVAHRSVLLAAGPHLPLDAFDAEPGPETEPVELDMANPLAVDAPRAGGALGLLLALKDAGLCDARLLRRAVEAVASSERAASASSWALTCEAIGLATRGGWNADPASAERQASLFRPADASAVLMGRRIGIDALRRVLDLGDFPSDTSSLDAALPFVLHAVARAGNDGLEITRPDGTLSYAILDPAQVVAGPGPSPAPAH